MIALDTNVLVRYLTQDDPAQARAANRLIDNELSAAAPGMILTVVLAETIWVLGEVYGASEPEKAACAAQLLKTRQFKLQHHAVVERAVQAAGKAACGFTDCLIAELAAGEGCVHVVTFDRKASRHSGFVLLKP